MTGSTPQPDEPLSQQLYLAIRRKIITGELAPGSRLRERDLAQEFGVSRVPLREAFPQLEADGFISSSPRRGVTVTTLTLRDVDELFEARLGIEVYATRLAAARVAAGADVSPLREALARADAALLTMDADEIAEANATLHEEIVWLAGNSLLRTMLHSISGRYRWIFRMTFTPEADGEAKADGEQHHDMFDAILAGDPDLAAAVAWTHIEHGRKPTLARLEGKLPSGREVALTPAGAQA